MLSTVIHPTEQFGSPVNCPHSSTLDLCFQFIIRPAEQSFENRGGLVPLRPKVIVGHNHLPRSPFSVRWLVDFQQSCSAMKFFIFLIKLSSAALSHNSTVAG